MHKLQNGSQVTERPVRKPRVGTRGYFSESNDQGAPSHPGQDWFNDCIDEFANALAQADIPYDPQRLDHLARAISEAKANWGADIVSQTEAQAGTAATARKWTAQRVRQAIVAWWDSIPKGTAFNKNFGSTAGTVCPGNDSRLSDAREWLANTVSQAEAEGGESNTPRKWTAQRVHQAFKQFGIGAGAPNISNANTQEVGRINTLVAPWTNGPISANGTLMCFGESNAVNLQIFSTHGNGQVFWRFRTGVEGMTDWRKVWDDRNNGTISDALAGTSRLYADCSVLKNLFAQVAIGGSNQSWADYTASRASNVIYTNNTNAPIMVIITANQDNVNGEFYVDGLKIGSFGDGSGDIATVSFIVPAKSTYKIIFNPWAQTIWSELR